MKKNSNSPMKKEPRAKRSKSHGPVQRETKEVLAELVGKLRGKLDRKASSGSAGQQGLRCGLRPNLDRLTVGVDLGDQWSKYCILGLEGKTLSEGQVRTTQADLAGLFEALTPARVLMRSGDAFGLGAGSHRRVWARGAGGESAADGGVETAEAQE